MEKLEGKRIEKEINKDKKLGTNNGMRNQYEVPPPALGVTKKKKKRRIALVCQKNKNHVSYCFALFKWE